MNQVPVPGVSQSQLCREVGGDIAFYPTYAFVREVGRDAEACLFDKEPLYFIQSPGMTGSRPDIRVVGRRKSPLLETVQMFIDGSYAVFPELFFPVRCRQVVFQHPLVTVERNHLAGFFFNIHLRKEVFDTCIDRDRRIFIYILFPILVEIYPAIPVDRLVR